MPRVTYTEEEVQAIIRGAYVTGIRDALISAQGGALLSEEQVAILAPFLTDATRLRETVNNLLPLGVALEAAQGGAVRRVGADGPPKGADTLYRRR